MLIRVSTAGQAEGGFSLESQVERMRDIVKRCNYEPYEEILEDDGYQGDDWNRPAIRRGLELIKSGAVRALAWYSVDRFARDSPGGRRYIEEILKYKGEMVFGDIGKYSGDINFRLMLDMKLMMSEHEKRSIIERTVRGTRQKISRGLIHSTYAPYGYRKTEACGRHSNVDQFDIVAEEAKTIRLIFKLADDGLSLRAIAREMVALGVPPPKSKWNATMLSKILSSEAYIGLWHYGKRNATVPDPKRVRSKKARHRVKCSFRLLDKSEWAAPIAIPAIITDRALFERIAKRMRENQKTLTGPANDKFLLRGLVTCGECGSPCIPISPSNRSRLYYKCSRRDRVSGKALCGARSVRAEVLEAVTWQTMIETLSDPAQLKAKLDAQRASMQESSDPSKREALESKIKEAKSKIARCRKGYIEVADSDIEGQRYFDSEMKKYRAILDSAESELAHELPRVVAMQSITTVVREFTNFEKSMTRFEQQELMRKWISKVIYTKGEVEILFRIALDGDTGTSAGIGNGGDGKTYEVCESYQGNVYKLRIAKRVA